MTLQLEATACPLCGGEAHTTRYVVRDLSYAVPGQFRFVTCDRCGFMHLSPRPTQDTIHESYPSGYEPYRKAIEEQTGSRFLRWLRHRQLQTRCSQVARLARGGRLLDVGCSTGLFLNEMRRYGDWELAGVETDAGAATYGRETFGLDIFTGRLDDAPWEPASFDMITLWDVLEHLPQPLDAVRRLHTLLRPGAQLIVSVPNLDSLDARLFGPHWTGLDAPRHLSVFRKADVQQLLERSGFEIEGVYCFYGRYTTFAASLRLLLRAHMQRERLRKRLERSLSLPVWRYITLPYFALVDRLGKGTIVTLVARREGGAP